MFEAMSQEKRLDCCNDSSHLMNQKRQVKLKTCADVYDHWRSYKRLYKKAPKEGVEFQIDYIDTGLALDQEERKRAPIALALHGAPGSYHDFSLLIGHLTKQKVRVIAPNFPEYIATVKTKVLFRHSADEKASYLRDFLKAINVRKIDLLISHSSAIFPTLLILLNANNEAVARQRKHQTPSEDGQTGDDATARNLHGHNEGKQISGEISSVDSGVLVKGHADCFAGRGVDRGSEEVADAQAADQDEMFEDASDRLDGNNNKCYNNISIRNVNEVQDVNELVQNDALNNGTAEKAHGRDCKLQIVAGTKEDCKQERCCQGQVANIRKSSRRHSTDVIVKFDEPIEIKAVALFNPAGHRLPKSMKPTWFKCGSCHVYQHKLGRSIFRKFGPAFLTVVGVPVRVDNMDNVMLSATVMRNSKCQRVVNQLQQLSQMRIPTLLVFSENDKLIEKEIFYEMTQFMRLDSSKFDVFNNDGDIELSQSIMNDWIRVMVFKAGGHYAYSNYAKTVNKAVSDLLSRVTSKKLSN